MPPATTRYAQHVIVARVRFKPYTRSWSKHGEGHPLPDVARHSAVCSRPLRRKTNNQHRWQQSEPSKKPTPNTGSSQSRLSNPAVSFEPSSPCLGKRTLVAEVQLCKTQLLKAWRFTSQLFCKVLSAVASRPSNYRTSGCEAARLDLGSWSLGSSGP